MTKNTSFEKSVQELDDIVAKMESGDLSLDQSLELFERGIKLTRSCQKTLSEAETKIEKLMAQVDSTD